MHSKSSSFEINLYQHKQIVMNLFPPMPLKWYKFGPSAVSPFIELNNHGIVHHLCKKIFYLNVFHHNGTIRHAITPARHVQDIQNVPINYTCCFHSVSYVDLSCACIYSDNLEQLAIMCPNLQRLNLEGNVHCLENLQGLRVVHTCENLEGINLAEISVSQVESYVLLWELLSSLKKLTHLAVELCLMKHNDTNKQKLIGIFTTFHSLKALEIFRGYLKGCMECTNTSHFLFSYFLSLTYCRMYCFRYSALTYAITHCHKLRYLYEKDARRESLIPSSSSCHLHELCIYSLSLSFTDELVKVLSANGELECVILYVKSVSITGITTLISNSPKLTSFHVSMIKPLCNEEHLFQDDEYIDTIEQMCSYHKLFAAGSFSVRVIAAKRIQGMLDRDLIDTNLNSLWPPLQWVW